MKRNDAIAVPAIDPTTAARSEVVVKVTTTLFVPRRRPYCSSEAVIGPLVAALSDEESRVRSGATDSLETYNWVRLRRRLSDSFVTWVSSSFRVLTDSCANK